VNDFKKIIALDTYHAGQLAALHLEIDDPWEKPWSAQSYEEILKLPTTCAYGIETSGGRIIAFILTQMSEHEGEILFLMTQKNFRKQGLARLLLNHLIKTHKITDLFLDVCTDNKAARCFYEKEGFVPTGVRKNYYHAPSCSATWDAIQMGWKRFP